MLKRTADLFTTAYLVIIFIVYPFYMQDGYLDIGEAKNRFFLYVSLAAFVVFAVLAVIWICTGLWEIKQGRRAYLVNWDRISSTDLFVLLYATTVFLSYVLTDYREEALWGTEGWYIGCVLLLLLCGLYFFISRMWGGNEKIFYVLIGASAVVFLLGICNRFSYFPIKLEITQPDFISTLGNINWFCGYLSIAAPVGISMFVFAEGRWKKAFLGIYTVIVFMASFSQGSNSIFLWFAALFYILLWIGLENRQWLKNWMLLVILWGASAQLVRLMRYFLPGKYNYDVDNLCGYFTDSSMSLRIVLVIGVIFLIIKNRQEKEPGQEKKIRNRTRAFLLILPLILAVGWLVISVIYTGYGISIGEQKTAFREIFYLDAGWGNGRGVTFYAGIQAFLEMSLIHKLFGIGPDCFSKYVYSLPGTAMALFGSFGNSRLTNAHNELLTTLVNTGLFGVVFYLGIFISFVRGCMKKKGRNSCVFVPAVCVFCYLIHNMVSFAQVLNLPYAFLLMGMGMAVKRKEEKNNQGGLTNSEILPTIMIQSAETESRDRVTE
ncbi:MAG: O-antigen ligase family protein [Suilimivivens sp.]